MHTAVVAEASAEAAATETDGGTARRAETRERTGERTSVDSTRR